MAISVIPQNQIVYNDPYTQRLFEYKAPGAQCEYVLARAVNNLLKLYGDKVFKGLRITSASIDSDNNLVVTIGKGVAVADSTLVFINEDTTLTLSNVTSFDLDSTVFAVFLNYQYLFSLNKNPAKIILYRVDSETTLTDSSFDINKDRLLLCYLTIDSNNLSITVYCDPDDYLIVNNVKYYVGGSSNGDEFQPFESYLDRISSSKRIFQGLYDNVLQMIIDYVENNVLDVLKQQDGHNSGLDADMVDGLHASDLAKVDLSNVFGESIISRLIDVDGHSSGIDADMVDGKHATDFADKSLSNVNDDIILNKLKNVDTNNSGLNATTLQGHDSSYFADKSLSNVDDDVILDKLKNVDTDNSGLNATTLQGHDSSYFADKSLSNVDDNTILNKLKNVDGPLSGLDADRLDGHDSSYFADKSLSNVDDNIILDKLRHVDGQNSGLDADKLDGRHASEFAFYNLNNVSSRLILQKILEVDDNDSGLNATTLQSYEPSKTSKPHVILVTNENGKIPKEFLDYEPSRTSKPYVIPVTNENGKIPREFLDLDDNDGGSSNNPPVINSINWNSSNLQGDQQYTVTINATDPDNDSLQYKIICNRSDVTISPSDWTANNTFTVTFPQYSQDTTITFTYQVTDGSDTTTQSEQKVVAASSTSNNPPVINSEQWSYPVLYEGQSYTVTINATDEDGDTLQYKVVCSDSNVTISPSGWSSSNQFDVSFPNYDYGDSVDSKSITFTYYVTDGSNTVSDSEVKTVYMVPMIKSIIWSDYPLFGGQTYTVTINAFHPDGSSELQYHVTCDVGSPYVNITPSDWSNNNTFTVSFYDFRDDVDILFVYAVEDTHGNQRTSDETVTVYASGSSSNGPYGVFAGGENDSNVLDYMEYVTVTSSVTVTGGYYLTQARFGLAATSNGRHDCGVFGGGNTSDTNSVTTMDYVTISTKSNANSGFQNLSYRRHGLAATSNGSGDVGAFAAGYNSNDNSYLDIIEYINIIDKTVSSAHGSLGYSPYALAATSNAEGGKGVFAGGYGDNTSTLNTMKYIDVSTTSNAQPFGTLYTARAGLAATSNGTSNIGIFVGGYHESNIPVNVIESVNIASSSGGASSHGQLAVARIGLAATSNGTDDVSVFGGGYNNGYLSSLEWLTISTGGAASSNGSLTVASFGLAATSNA